MEEGHSEWSIARIELRLYPNYQTIKGFAFVIKYILQGFRNMVHRTYFSVQRTEYKVRVQSVRAKLCKEIN